MKTLETERLILRAWQVDDLDDFNEYARNPNVGPAAGWEPHASKGFSLGLLEEFIDKDETWAIVERAGGKAIGSVGLHPDRKRGDVNARMMGYVLSEDYWGMGYATEAARAAIRYAFEEMGLEVLSICHYPFNQRSRRVIEKCGFRYEGTIRRCSKIYDGSIYDDVCYSLLRAEYFEDKGAR